MAWTVETLNETVDAALPVDMRARLIRISELIEAGGLPNVREPHVNHPVADEGPVQWTQSAAQASRRRVRVKFSVHAVDVQPPREKRHCDQN
jgi:hypothetical protein